MAQIFNALDKLLKKAWMFYVFEFILKPNLSVRCLSSDKLVNDKQDCCLSFIKSFPLYFLDRSL